MRLLSLLEAIDLPGRQQPPEVTRLIRKLEKVGLKLKTSEGTVRIWFMSAPTLSSLQSAVHDALSAGFKMKYVTYETEDYVGPGRVDAFDEIFANNLSIFFCSTLFKLYRNGEEYCVKITYNQSDPIWEMKLPGRQQNREIRRLIKEIRSNVAVTRFAVDELAPMHDGSSANYYHVRVDYESEMVKLFKLLGGYDFEMSSAAYYANGEFLTYDVRNKPLEENIEALIRLILEQDIKTLAVFFRKPEPDATLGTDYTTFGVFYKTSATRMFR